MGLIDIVLLFGILVICSWFHWPNIELVLRARYGRGLPNLKRMMLLYHSKLLSAGLSYMFDSYTTLSLFVEICLFGHMVSVTFFCPKTRAYEL